MNKIEEIRERLEAAAPGPWKFDFNWNIRDGNGSPVEDHNGQFIINAPDDMRTLLAEADRLQVENTRLDEQNTALWEQCEQVPAKIQAAVNYLKRRKGDGK